MIKIKKTIDKDVISKTTLEIMNSLRKWFNPLEDIVKKSSEHRNMPFYTAYNGNEVIGFIALKIHNDCTVEIYNMGVKVEYHNQGIGGRLLTSVECYCKDNGYKFITIKTLDSSTDYEPYEKTRKFYFKNEYYPLEVFPLYWNKDNPCLFLAKYIG